MATDISHEKLLTMLSYTPETGEFRWRESAPNFGRRKDVVGRVDTHGRRYINLERQSYSAHRLAWFYVTKQWSKGAIVPKNGDHLDTRFDNLAELSHQDMAKRRKPRENASSGETGVSWDSRRYRWVAYIKINYKRIHLGYFKLKEDAVAAYKAADSTRAHHARQTEVDLAKMREAGRRDARYRDLWRRVNRRYAGRVNWPNMKALIADVGLDLHDRQEIVPIDDNAPIGPGNWKWELSLFYRLGGVKADRSIQHKAFRERNPLGRRANEFMKKFGITVAEYFRMHNEQSGMCACCGVQETMTRDGITLWLAVDHCHLTGAVRGLLCGNCNNGIGRFKEDPILLRNAAAYLERHANKSDGAALDQLKTEERDAHHGYHTFERP